MTRMAQQAVRAIRVLTLMLIGALAWLGAATVAGASDDTTAKVTIEATSVGLGLGATWGDGILEYRGKQYRFSVRGFTIGDVGVAKVSAKGDVYNLKNIEEFTGRFFAGSAGASLGGGVGASAMVNQNHVSMVLTSTMQGLSISLAQAGIAVSLENEPGVKRDVQPARSDEPGK